MATVTDYGTIDGEPAKIVYDSQCKQTHIYFGGRGSADGPGHDRAVIQDSNPDTMHFLRQNGRIVVNQS